MDDMKEFRIVWTRCPTAHNTPQVMFVKAADANAAKAIARRHIERSYCIEWFSIDSVKIAEPVPAGEVLSR